MLLNLCCVGQIELLRQLFKEVVIPPEVATEFGRLSSQVPRFTGLALPTWVRQQAAGAVSPLVRSATGLDPGETAALALAIEIHADAILVDERRGHQVAVQLGLRTIGVVGVLIQAKSAGLLRAIAPVLDQLEQDAGFWIGPGLRVRVLQLAGEQS